MIGPLTTMPNSFMISRGLTPPGVQKLLGAELYAQVPPGGNTPVITGTLEAKDHASKMVLRMYS